MNAIVAVDNTWGIGKEGDLLCHIPGDLNYYKEKTLGKTIIMGRKTLESLPGGKPLPKRKNIVLTRNIEISKLSFENRDFHVVLSKEDLYKKLEELDKDSVFVSGGAEIYKELLPLCNKIYVTKINGDYSADTFFPNLDQVDEFEVSWKSEENIENGIEYQFFIYERK